VKKKNTSNPLTGNQKEQKGGNFDIELGIQTDLETEVTDDYLETVSSESVAERK
ncbi:4800_t:CDS:2, partial [Gigaspora margarita]